MRFIEVAIPEHQRIGARLSSKSADRIAIAQNDALVNPEFNQGMQLNAGNQVVRSVGVEEIVEVKVPIRNKVPHCLCSFTPAAFFASCMLLFHAEILITNNITNHPSPIIPSFLRISGNKAWVCFQHKLRD